MAGFNETQHRRNPDGTFADMGNTRLKAACGTANARPDFSGMDLRGEGLLLQGPVRRRFP